MSKIGKLKILKTVIEWEIDDFCSLSINDSYFISPSFFFADYSWHLRMYPYGARYNASIGYVSVYLFRESCHLTKFNCSFALKTSAGKKVFEKQQLRPTEENAIFAYTRLFHRSELLKKKSVLLPSGILTVMCSLEVSQFTDNSGENEAANSSSSEKKYNDKSVSTEEQQCQIKPIRCSACNNEASLEMWSDNECRTGRVKAIEKMVDDFTSLLNSDENSDVIFSVKDKEFHLHRSILSVRNPYFKSLLNTEMKEKNTGIVSVKDCDPDIFGTFIRFIYTGKVDNLSAENVSDLYSLADKYQEDQLKAQCICFMRKNLSTDNFCDFIVVALTHNEKELLSDATELFCKNIKYIIESVKWQCFMSQYPTQANELLIKAVKYHNL